MSLLARLLPPSDSQRPADLEGLTPGGWSVTIAWRRFVGLLADYQWWVLAVASVAAFILGCIGWWQQLLTEAPGVSDVAYLSFKNFFMESDANEPGLPWQLNVARYLAPILAGWAGLSALGLLFRDRVQQLRIPWMRDHVVICGLGEYVGSVFVRHLRGKRIRVVVIELDAANPSIELCRGMGVPVIVGDARRLRTLQTAGAHRARRVLAVTDDDTVNTQIVATWRRMPGLRSRRLGCLARIADPDSCSLLRIQEAQHGQELSVDFFNIDEIGARLLLKQFPIVTDRGQPHILVAHLDPLGGWLVYHAARIWHDKRGHSQAPLMVTLLEDKPEESIQAMISRHPELKSVCDFKPFHATTEVISELLPRHHLDPATPHISHAYVTAYRDQQAFDTALKLHHELHQLDPPVPVVVALSHSHGVADLLGDVKKAGALANVDVFPTMERTCTVELVQGGSFEPLAEEIHETWRTQQLKEGNPAPLWKDLDESRKESSRAQARHIAVKLRTIHCAMAPLHDWDAKDFKFTQEEIEMLAAEEHNRWWRERRADGWTLIPMPAVDDEDEAKRIVDEAKYKKESPYLIPWADMLELYPDIAEYDRIFVREIPDRLASAGLQAIRTETTATLADNKQAVSA